MRTATGARALRAATCRPLTAAVGEAPEPFFCPACWTDFYLGAIDGDELLATVTAPLRRWTAWVCPRCTGPGEEEDLAPTPSERHAALLDIRANLAWWAVREGIVSEEEQRRREARDEF